MLRDYSGATTDAQLVVLWLSGRPASTVRVYTRVSESFLASLPAGLQAATVADFIGWTERLTGKPATRAREVSTVKSLLSFGYRTGYCLFNIGRVVKCVSVPSTLHERIVEEPVIASMIEAASPGRDRTLIRLLYASGCRISELVKLRFVDVIAGRVTFMGKGARSRAVLVPVNLTDEMNALRRPGDEPQTRIFRSVRRRPLDVRDAREIVYQVADKAGVALSPHWMRHAFASHSLDNGAPIHLVQRDLGHASVATTSRYLHARPNKGASQYLKV